MRFGAEVEGLLAPVAEVDAQPWLGVAPLVHGQVAGERLGGRVAAARHVGEQLRPVAGRVVRRGHHPEVRRVEVGEHDEAVAPVVDGVLDVLLARPHQPGWRRRLAGRQHVDLGRRLAARHEHDPALAAGGADVQGEPLVGLLQHEHVGADRRAQLVAPDLVRAHLLVGAGVEQPAPVAGPGEPTPRRRSGQLVRQLLAGGQLADPHRVALAAVGVAGPGQQRVVGRRLDGVDVEELVAVGLGVAVEDDVGGGLLERPPATEHGVRLALDRPADVPPRAVAHRHRLVGLLDPRLDLGEQLLDEVLPRLEEGGGVGVLGFEVGDRVGVLAVAQPGPRVVGGPGGALPRVRLLRGDGGSVMGSGERASERASGYDGCVAGERSHDGAA